MTDDTAARLRALESEERLLRERVKWHTAVDFPTMSVRTDVLLALLDALDEARRERDDTRAKERRALREAFDAVRERDAAVALLREAQHAIALAGYGSRMAPEVADTIRRIDALLGGGEG